MKICVYGAASNEIDRSFIEAGEALGSAIAKEGHTLIFGGGACGMMGAAARGAAAKGGEIIGISPSFFNVDGVLFENCTQMIYTETMRERKQLLEDMSDAFVVTAGGVGTFDEFFETLSLKQLSIHKKPIAILNTNGYFDHLIKMLEYAAENRFMAKANLDLFYVSDNTEAILEYFNNHLYSDTKIEDLRKI